MNQCPFCRAQIEDNARFCLYCMTPLNQKEVIAPRKRNVLWLPLTVVGVLLVVLVVLLLLPDREAPQEPTASTTMPTVTSTTSPTTAPTAEPTGEAMAASTAENTEPSAPTTTPTVTPTAEPGTTQVPTGETAAATEATSATDTQTTGPTGTRPVMRPTTSLGAKPTTSPAIPTTSFATSPATAVTTKPSTTSTKPIAPATKATTAPTVMPATKPTSVAATTNQPTSGATTAPAAKPTTKPPTTAASAPITQPTTVPTSAPTTQPTTAPTTAPTTVPTVTTAPTAAPTVPAETVSADAVIYAYVPAEYSLVWGTPAENDVLITDITAPADMEEIVIPAYLNGKRVIGLEYPSFSNFSKTNSNLTTVYLPKTLLWLSPNAFDNTNIWDLYITGESLYLAGDSGVDWMQIHSSKTCKNQYGGKLFSRSAYWVEWDGSMPEPTNFVAFPSCVWEEPETGNIFTYRQAVQSDVLGLDYQVTENDVVITHIDEINLLEIPAYVDNKRVIALGPFVFKLQDDVKSLDSLILPETLVAIHCDVFTGTCIQFLYFRGETLAIHNDSGLGYVYFYCSKTCVDQYGDKYSDRSGWREWNG